MKLSSKTLTLAAIITLSIALTSCAPGPNTLVQTSNVPAGFWYGFWHGSIAPITFVISLFNENVNIYEIKNNGDWYNFGYLLGSYLLGIGAFSTGVSNTN
jgi:hypothetical protein